jgi:TonB family protein
MSQRNERSTHVPIDEVTHWLIHHAARRAPQSLSSRLEEEWLADLESRSAALSRLRFALGCCWATVVIVHDHPRAQVAAASAAASTSGNFALTDRNFGYFSLRSGTLFLIAGLHGIILYGLITTLAHTHGVTTPPNLQLDPVQPAKLPPQISPTLNLNRWVVDVPMPVVHVPPKLDIEEEVTARVDETPKTNLPPSPPATSTHIPRKIAGGPGAGFPDTADFYPSHSIRLGEQGISTVRVCVDPNGKLASDPTIVQSSGSARLDEGALRLARAGSGHYRASTEDDRPVNSCYPVGIRFALKN